MRLRRRRLRESRLYALIDKDTLKGPASALAKKLAVSGADIIQLRDKNSPKVDILKEALSISQALKNTRSLFIVNDYPGIAKSSGSDGVHIGQSDVSVRAARNIVGKNRLIGVSCSDLKQALKAQNSGADYIGVGPVFKTSLKAGCRPIGLKGIKDLNKRISIPVFAIGNINKDNLSKVTSCGINRIALCRALLKTRNIPKAVKYFSARLKK
ncbi:MAG: thiamine phosphate synthase [Candidatus Omnitrophica bacterium]|nr:thiamine phosphate synthase [Candidatus Omnitrophota bacterium]